MRIFFGLTFFPKPILQYWPSTTALMKCIVFFLHLFWLPIFSMPTPIPIRFPRSQSTNLHKKTKCNLLQTKTYKIRRYGCHIQSWGLWGWKSWIIMCIQAKMWTKKEYTKRKKNHFVCSIHVIICTKITLSTNTRLFELCISF